MFQNNKNKERKEKKEKETQAGWEWPRCIKTALGRLRQDNLGYNSEPQWHLSHTEMTSPPEFRLTSLLWPVEGRAATLKPIL